jgi:predicted dehydrogenase
MRMIQVGAGAWGSSWAGIVAASPHWELAALVDLDEAALANVADKAGLPLERRFRSLSDATRAIEADAALVAVPPALHAEVALEALESDLHCVVEKPLATSIEEARVVVKRADEVSRLLMASQNFRFDAGYRTVRRLVADGAIGGVGRITVDFRRAPLFVGFRLQMEEPLLIDMAVHHFDQLRGLVEARPVTLRATSYNPAWSPFHGSAVANVEVELDGVAVFNYWGSWVTRGPETSWNGDWFVEGERGAIVWRDKRVDLFTAEPPSSGLLRRIRGPQTRVPLDELAEEGRSGVLAELADAIRTGREPETSGRDNLGTLELVYGAVQSAQNGQPITLSH